MDAYETLMVVFTVIGLLIACSRKYPPNLTYGAAILLNRASRLSAVPLHMLIITIGTKKVKQTLLLLDNITPPFKAG